MKNFILSGWLAASLALVSCQSLFPSRGSGTLRIGFDDFASSDAVTKSTLPDTDDFIIKVTGSDGGIIYSGLFGASPENLIVSAGTYTVQAWSCEFSVPTFDTPQYGDTQAVVVKEGETSVVTLHCTQVNAGILLDIHPDFLTEYPSGVLFLKGASGKLMYSYSEKRIAYFEPGAVSLVLSNAGAESTLFTKSLAAREILRVRLTVASQSETKGGIAVEVDTSRNWTAFDYELGSGSGSGGDDVTEAYSVAEARERAGETDVWVCGYIVGGDLSSSRCSFEEPFSSRTNLVLASRSSCTDRESCLSVQLAKGDIRDELNLVDHPDLLGSKVYLKGDIVEAYYGIPGLQCVTEYMLK